MVFIGIGIAILTLALAIYLAVKAYPAMEHGSRLLVTRRKSRARTTKAEAKDKADGK